MAFVIRPALPSDAEGCRAIYGHFVTETWVSFEEEVPSAREMKRRIEGYGYSHGWVVAEADGRIAGYAYGSPYRLREAYRFSCDVAIYVDPASTGQGIGRGLYDALFPLLAAKDIHSAHAGIALPNDSSVAFHKAAGFREVGTYREVGWKFDAWRDVSWWQKLL